MTLQSTALPKATSIRPAFVSTTNACKLCKPLGAAIAFRGIEGCVPFLHGSQGCATYMRRYLISHFREPVDIASSSLGEKHAIYGGGANLKQGLSNVIAKLRPSLIGIASTCLTETIGDDVPRLVREFIQENQGGCGEAIPPLVTVATPSFGGSHMEGFHAAVKAVVEQLVVPGPRDSATGPDLNLLPGFVSPADLRYLKEIIEYFNLVAVLLPDISETLDGPALMDYQKIPAGGTPLAAIRAMGQARATLELGRVLIDQAGAGRILERRFGVPLKSLGLPIGLRETDRLFEVLADLSGRDPSPLHALERGRLIDSYVDGHKIAFGKRAVVYGDEDLVVGITALLVEVGIQPVLCASGGKSGALQQAVREVTADLVREPPTVIDGADFFTIEQEVERLAPDLLIGHGKGQRIARAHGVPLVRIGFPVHDRFGGQRLLHLGYRGAQALFDRIVNALLEVKQAGSPVGYGYM